MIPDFGDLFRAMGQIEDQYGSLRPAVRQMEESYRSLRPAIARALENAPAILKEAERAQPLVQELSQQLAFAHELLSSNREARNFARDLSSRYVDALSARAAFGDVERGELHALADGSVSQLLSEDGADQQVLLEALSPERQEPIASGRDWKKELGLLIGLLGIVLAAYAVDQSEKTAIENTLDHERQIAVVAQIQEGISALTKEVEVMARSHQVSTTTIVIVANTIPGTYGQKRGVEDAVRRAIGNRPGEWEIWLEEPQNGSLHRIAIHGPQGLQREWNFDGPDEQAPDFVESTIRRDLGQSGTLLSR